MAARFDAFKIGMSVALGGGGTFGLYLAWRRQRSTEIALQQKDRDQTDVARAFDLQVRIADDTRQDAAERRITDLYSKSSEQLGSDKAPVRLAGLYALERLAQTNIDQRQVIVNVLCAYLRMPFIPPDVEADSIPQEEQSARIQEQEVRYAAQRILADHLRQGIDPTNPAESYWEGITLDLSNATLSRMNLVFCNLHRAYFGGTTFVGTCYFDEATFRDSTFADATFTGHASFHKVTFLENAFFTRAHFAEIARFADVTFAGEVGFMRAKFEHHASFERTTFADTAYFSEASFTGSSQFDAARFKGVTSFRGASFGENGSFSRASFSKRPDFSNTTFEGPIPPEVRKRIKRATDTATPAD